MTKDEKIASLATAMRQSTRGKATAGQLDPEGEQYYHFTDAAPEELKNLYLEHYDVRDIDYETFFRACDIVSDIYADDPKADADKVESQIYERASDSANVYNNTRLSYLNIWNQDEIAEYVRSINSDISDACAYWYDNQVEQAAMIINEWINAV